MNLLNLILFNVQLCLRVTTGGSTNNGGNVDVFVDSGNGYVEVTSSDHGVYGTNEQLPLNPSCFDSLVGIQVAGPTDNA